MINHLITLTGFGPFNKNFRNLSGEIVKNFPSKIQKYPIIKRILPVSWKRSIESYKSLIASLESQPKLVVLLGIHSSKDFHLEKFGWNYKFGQDIDNIFKFGMIKHCFSPRIKTILNINKIFINLRDKMNILVSWFPGLYLCNFIYYWALNISNQEYPVLFIHIPESGELNKSIKKIEMILRAIINLL